MFQFNKGYNQEDDKRCLSCGQIHTDEEQEGQEDVKEVDFIEVNPDEVVNDFAAYIGEHVTDMSSLKEELLNLYSLAYTHGIQSYLSSLVQDQMDELKDANEGLKHLLEK